MPTALGPRFVLEAGFLVLLALLVGLADLDPLLIVLVMLVGWILVSLIEYFAWRQSRAGMMRGFEPALAGVGVSEMAADDSPPPPPPPPSAPAQPPDEDTVVEPPPAEEEQPEEPEAEEPPASAAEEPEPAPEAEEPAPAAAGEETTEPATADERRVEHRLEPLKPRPRRKWIFFGPYERSDKPAEDDNEA
jgi:outer membrane biosynthesis protein TonB